MIFSVHIVMLHETVGSEKELQFIHEDVYLVSAESLQDALAKGNNIGRISDSDAISAGFFIDDIPARVRFVGIRKVNKVSDSDDVRDVVTNCDLVATWEYHFSDRKGLVDYTERRDCSIGGYL